MTYQEALDYLYSFVDYSLTRAFRYSPEKFDLDRMVDLVHMMGDPQSKYPIIHLAGTKGKGSTAALIASALMAAGYRVGFYSSPHLSEYYERIQVNGKCISPEILATYVEEIKTYATQVEKITTFELTTALAFQFFARQKVDIAVVEVGLGGRLDATNVVDPLVSVITSLSMDHTAVLGDTLAKIAFEKAGIIKPGRPVIVSPQKEEARKVVEQVANERGSRLVQIGRDFLFAPWTHSLDDQSLLVWSVDEQPMADQFIESGGRFEWEPLRLSIPLLGNHQVENAATAYATLKIINEQGLSVSDEEIRTGYENVFWPARFEVLRRNPPIIVDSAHNPDSALRLRMAIDDYMPDMPVILIYGASEDKDVDGMFAELMPRVRQVVATKSFHPRAMDSSQLVDLAHRFGKQAVATENIEEALRTALDLAGADKAILASGSLFVAAAVRDVWAALGNPVRMFEVQNEKDEP